MFGAKIWGGGLILCNQVFQASPKIAWVCNCIIYLFFFFKKGSNSDSIVCNLCKLHQVDAKYIKGPACRCTKCLAQMQQNLLVQVGW